MNLNKIIILLTTILVLSTTLRLFNLDKNPPALDWDEASLGYNAYSLLRTGKDEYGEFLPLSLRSFGDYKPPMYVYLTVLPTYLLGLNEWAVRLSSALLGFATVLATFVLVRLLTQSTEIEMVDSQRVSLLSSLFLAISPWHLQFSRASFEANVGLFFAISGVALFLGGLRRSRLLHLSSVSIVASLYSYHSNRLVIPILFIGLLWMFRKQIWEKKKIALLSALLGLVFLIPLVLSTVMSRNIIARFTAVSVLKAPEQRMEALRFKENDTERGDWFGSLWHDRRILYALNYISAYGDHFNLPYLFLRGDEYVRHNAHRMGLLYYIDFPLIIIGVYILFHNFSSKIRLFLLWWFLVAPSASALTFGTPHAVRSLLYLPTYQIFSAIGTLAFLRIFKKRLNILVLNLLVTIPLALNMLYYLDVYHIHTPAEVSSAWQYGYKQAVGYIKQREKDVTKIVFTNRYDQPYIYYLFYAGIDPKWYQQVWRGAPPSQDLRFFDKFEFRKIDWSKDNTLRRAIVVGSGGDQPEIPGNADNIAREIFFLDGSVAFRIVDR